MYCNNCGNSPCIYADWECSYGNEYRMWKPSCFEKTKKQRDCKMPRTPDICLVCTNLNEEIKEQWKMEKKILDEKYRKDNQLYEIFKEIN